MNSPPSRSLIAEIRTSLVHRWQAGDLRYAPWVLALAVFALVRWAQLTWAGWGTGSDTWLYLQYASAWGRGEAPYVNFHPEYPAGSLPLFLAPFLVGGSGDYQHAFAAEMALFDLLSFLTVIAWTRQQDAGSFRRATLAGAVYLLTSAALFPVLYARYDLAPGAITLFALYLLYARPRSSLSSTVLGLAIGVKLWPLTLLPMWMVVALRRHGVRGVARTALAVAFGVFLTVLPVIARAGTHVFEFLRFHSARGIQIETTWSTIALLLNAIHVASAYPIHEFGAFHVKGDLTELFASASMPLMLALPLIPQVLAWFGKLGRQEDRTGIVGGATATATVLGFMVAGKVLSPQYMLWLVPLMAIAARGPLLTIVTVSLACLTTAVYPYLSPALEQREPGHEWALATVGTRNLLLVALYVWYAIWAFRSRYQTHARKGEPQAAGPSPTEGQVPLPS